MTQYLVIIALVISFILLFLYFMYGKDIKHDPLVSNQGIDILTRQTARWALAASQDASPLIALLHANYAAGYLWALKDICTDTQFNEATGLDRLLFEQAIVTIQDTATQAAVKSCPNLTGKDLSPYLLKISGDE